MILNPLQLEPNGNNFINIDGFVKSPRIVMPDLIRHPELIEFTGFRLPDRVRHKLRRNDGKTEELTFYEFINIKFKIIC
jgi:hypothetical protein